MYYGIYSIFIHKMKVKIVKRKKKLNESIFLLDSYIVHEMMK